MLRQTLPKSKQKSAYHSKELACAGFRPWSALLAGAVTGRRATPYHSGSSRQVCRPITSLGDAHHSNLRPTDIYMYVYRCNSPHSDCMFTTGENWNGFQSPARRAFVTAPQHVTGQRVMCLLYSIYVGHPDPVSVTGRTNKSTVRHT